MLTQLPVEEGFKNRKYHRKKQRTTKVFYFVHDPVGRVVKTLIGKIGDSRVGPDVVIRRNFTEQGAGAEILYNYLLCYVPWFPKYYEDRTGEKLTPHIIHQRYLKMYIEDDKPIISQEHYLHDPRLRQILPEVDKLFLKGEVISEDVARRVGNHKEPTFI